MNNVISKPLGRLSLLVTCIMMALIWNSCSVTKSMFSKGRPEFKLAKAEMAKGNGLKSMDHALAAVIIDPEVPAFQKYIYSHYNNTMDNTFSFLKRSENTQNLGDAEKRVAIYDQLIIINQKLGQVTLPFEDHKKGEWSWTTQIKDYTAQAKAAKEYAYNLFLKQAREDLKKSEVKMAYEKYRKMYDKYTLMAQKSATAALITKDFVDFSKKHEGSSEIETLELVHYSYGCALKFTPAMEVASEGRKNTALKIAELYFAKGQKLFKSGSVDDKIKSVECFTNAIKWNPEHLKAKAQLAQVKIDIADIYYNKGFSMEKKKGVDIQEVIALYRKAQKWVPNYKDSMYRIYSIGMTSELKDLKQNLAKTRTEYNALAKRIVPISASVDKSNEVMGMVTYVSDNCRSLNTKMKAVSSTLSAFAVIPVVGGVASVTAHSLSSAQKPVGGLVGKFNAIEKPIITPTKAAVGKVKLTVDNVKVMLGKTKKVLEVTEKTVAEVDKCIQNLKLESDFKKVEGAVKEMNKGVKGTANEMHNINNGLNAFEGSAKQIAKLYSPLKKVKSGISKVKPVVDKVNKVTHEMDKVLKKSVSINLGFKKFELSIHGVLTTGGAAAKALSKLAMKALNPVLKKFKIGVPKIPGISEVSSKLDGVKNEYQKVKTETEKITNAYKKYTDVEAMVVKNVNKIVETTGCGVKIEPKTAK